MQIVLTLPKQVIDDPPRLTPEEVKECVAACFQIHDHSASTPQLPIWWERVNTRYTS